MLLRLATEFEEVVSKMVDGHTVKPMGDEQVKDDDMQAIQALMTRLVEAMNKLISVNKTPVLVIDGLDKLSTLSQIRKVTRQKAIIHSNNKTEPTSSRKSLHTGLMKSFFSLTIHFIVDMFSRGITFKLYMKTICF